MYCSAKHQYEAKKESWRKTKQKQYHANPKKDMLRHKGTIDLPPRPIINGSTEQVDWEKEEKIIKKLKTETFRRSINKGKQMGGVSLHSQDTPNNPLITHHQATFNDYHNFSISYLKEQNVKCDECSSKTNEIVNGLIICRDCGLILKAPSIHSGFIVDDTLPLWKVAPTLQDINQTKNTKEAHHLAYSLYWEQVGIIDPNNIDEIKHLKQVQEDWNAAWKHYKKVTIKKREGRHTKN